MKFKFKIQTFQTKAVEAVIDCFAGQPFESGNKYRIDPGVVKYADGSTQEIVTEDYGFCNAEIKLTDPQLLANIQTVQKNQNLYPISNELFRDKISRVNLDIEMETGTGKTYCYIKTMFELNKQYGWSKFIVIVPSIAIREGVNKTFQITADHFLEEYGKKARFFIYNSKTLQNIESFSSDGNINVMIINVQAFNSRGKDNRRIYDVLDEFQSRRPIDVIKANKPIVIIDEPQKVEGKATKTSLEEFNALVVFRYSATHKETHNKIYRLDALDAYNQKLVKKIAVRGISVKGLTGTNTYLYLESIEVSKQAPIARIDMEVKQSNGIKRVIKRLGKGARLFDESGGLAQYEGLVISDINAITDIVYFSGGLELQAGEATGNLDEPMIRRIQIREAIKAHFSKERELYHKGIKVLTLFFIDEVAKYRIYDENGNPDNGEYGKIFEEEYNNFLNDEFSNIFNSSEYETYVKNINVTKTHDGYFSIDKNKRMIDPDFDKKEKISDDTSAYDLILKDKERLLSFDEPVRFIFSHSALREGWDNPNVFIICFLKHSLNDTSRRQEVGRGLRLSVNQNGDRQDNPTTVHETNVLTVVANESYGDFVIGLQKEIVDALSERPRKANEEYFTGKTILIDDDAMEISSQMARQIYRYLVKNDYTDDNDSITPAYYSDKNDKTLAPLPDELKLYETQIHQLIQDILTNSNLPAINNARNKKFNPLNSNFNKREFIELWNRINKQAVYKVDFDSSELIEKAVERLNSDLRVRYLEYTVQSGVQDDKIGYEELKDGETFRHYETRSEREVKSIHSNVKYDLIGSISEGTVLTRRTVAAILTKIDKPVFEQFKVNPEHFIQECVRLIKEEKSAIVIEHLSYNEINSSYNVNIFTDAQNNQDFNRVGEKLRKHIYDYCITDSKREHEFVNELDTSLDVAVYAKLPKGFAIPTPMGDYNPDWAISFYEKNVKHIYFVAETKGSMSSLQLRGIEDGKTKCAEKFFETINAKIEKNKVKYSIVDSFDTLMGIVR